METVSLDSPFLSDEKPIEIIETMIEKHKKIIVEAPTGVGKTYTFIDLAKKALAIQSLQFLMLLMFYKYLKNMMF